MAASSLGLFGDFKYHKDKTLSNPQLETVWISKPYDPLDERDTAPVPRSKVIDTPKSTGELTSEWLPTREQSLRDISRRNEEATVYPSLRTTRCEEWSTLRETLPSRGSARRIEHPRWGTGLGGAPVCSVDPPRRNPMITSAMSRFVDDMHLTHRNFKLF